MGNNTFFIHLQAAELAMFAFFVQILVWMKFISRGAEFQ
jgi:hypothetical protein